MKPYPLLLSTLAIASLSSCSEKVIRQQVSEPVSLFSEGFEEAWYANRALYEDSGCPTTERPSEIRWATDIKSAIERATKEDKPIFVANFVRENGDPACDV